MYVTENLISRCLGLHIKQTDIQVVPFELNIRKEKWLVLTIYKVQKQNSQ